MLKVEVKKGLDCSHTIGDKALARPGIIYFMMSAESHTFIVSWEEFRPKLEEVMNLTTASIHRNKCSGHGPSGGG